MKTGIIFRLVGILIILFALSLTIPLLISLYYQDGAQYSFVKSIVIILVIGLIFSSFSSSDEKNLRTRDGMIITISSWLILAFCGTLPFVFAAKPLSFVDAWFESMSGLTTTGSTILVDTELLSVSLLFYRQFLQWIGGMGIILLAVAVLPVLGVGGMQLYRTEIPGPVKDTKLTPRITETAKLLWGIYIVLTIACTLAYKLAGMSFMDAINHSFSTVSIGGFSPHKENFGYFDSPAIQLVAILFMFLASMNFALHFYVWDRKSLVPYWQDPEWKFFVSFILLTLFGITLLQLPQITDGASLIATIFQGISVITTTGYTLNNYNGFSLNILFFLFAFASIGCCAGSAGGGIKAIRFLLLIKQGHRECKRVVHPHGVFNVRLSGNTVSDRILEAVWGFCSIYLVSFFIIMSLLLLTGADHLTAWSATIATINNLGPALGDAAINYADMGNAKKLILSFAMLIGRLEVFTFVVLLLPIAWR